MIPGNTVSLIEYGGRIIGRTVVSVENGVLYVCKREDFEVARQEGREPTCIGF
jgi:hypothetical protein